MNKEQGNIITDWLEKYGNPEIEKQVEKEIEHINTTEMLKVNIKEYCKYMKLKFVKYHENGFIASYNFPVKARIVLIFILPFMVVDLIVLPFSLLYWLMTGIMIEPLCQQLIETTRNEK